MNANVKRAAFVAALALAAGTTGCATDGLIGLNCVTEVRVEGASPETVCDEEQRVVDEAEAPEATRADDADHEAESDASVPIRKRGEKAER